MIQRNEQHTTHKAEEYDSPNEAEEYTAHDS